MEFIARKSYDCVTGKDTAKDFVGCHSIGDFQQVGPTEYVSNLPPKKVTPFVGKTVGAGVRVGAGVGENVSTVTESTDAADIVRRRRPSWSKFERRR